MNSLLSKFENVKIENKNRLASDDYDFCERAQKIHDVVLVRINESYKKVQLIKEEETEFYNSIYDMNEDLSFGTIIATIDSDELLEIIKREKNRFANKIVGYFSEKYDVQLEKKDCKIYENLLQENRNNFTGNGLSYKAVLEDLFLQLGGMTFVEKADQQKKSAMNYIFNFKKPELKKEKVIRSNFFMIDSFYKSYKEYQVSYHYYEEFKNLLESLSYFNKDKEEFNKNVYRAITQLKNDEVFKIHDVNEVSKLKLYKNGKIEIIFNTAELAREFATDYCGYAEA